MRQRRAKDAQDATDQPQSQAQSQGTEEAETYARRMVPPQRLLMPGPQLYSSLVQHREAQADLQADLHYVVDQRLRAAAHRAPLSTPPPNFTAAVRSSISQARIAPPPIPLRRRVAARLRESSRRAQQAARLTDAQWRAAIGSAGALVAALVCGGVGFAIDPSEMFTLLGVGGALMLSLLALGHLLSAAVGAVMGSAALVVLFIAVYLGLAVLWVRLMRHPVEA